MKTSIQAEAFQRGLDAYYENWPSSKIALVRYGYQQEHGDPASDEFAAGFECAENDDALAEFSGANQHR